MVSINAQPDIWLENLKALQQAFVELTNRVNILEGVDAELANTREQVKESHDALNQAQGAHNLYMDQNAELTRQLQLAQLSNLNLAVTPVQARPSPNHPDPDKFNEDKTKLEAFVTQLRIKLQQNADHFVRSG